MASSVNPPRRIQFHLHWSLRAIASGRYAWRVHVRTILAALAFSIGSGLSTAADSPVFSYAGVTTVEDDVDYEQVAVNLGYKSLQAACESGSGTGSSACAADLVQKARVAMKQAYQAALDSLDPPGEHEEDQRRLLGESQRAWESYVSAQCYFYATRQLAGWNPWFEYWRHECELSEFRRRIKFLQGDTSTADDGSNAGEPE